MNTDKTMKLWLLRPAEGLARDNNPWRNEYDMAYGFVIRAETEEEAREMAHNKGGYENGRPYFSTTDFRDIEAPWKSPRYSTCIELLPEGPTEIVMRDFHAA